MSHDCNLDENESDEEDLDINHIEQMQEKLSKKNYESNQYRIASMSYSLVTCFLGLVIATIEPLKAC